MNNVAWTTVEVSRPVLLLNSCHEPFLFPHIHAGIVLVLSTLSATQLLRVIYIMHENSSIMLFERHPKKPSIMPEIMLKI